MTAYVVDASVAVKWFVNEDGSEIAEALLSSGQPLAAPEFLQVEAANALWKNALRGNLDANMATESATDLRRLIGSWHQDEFLLDAAARFAFALRHPVYDCMYLALAQLLDTQCLTADRRFLDVTARSTASKFIAPLKDWRP